MSVDANKDLVRRFIQLPHDKRTVFLQALAAKGISLSQLPIPETRAAFTHLPLSYAQERQWFLWTLEPGSCAYHIPVVLKLHGAFDADALQGALDALVCRHEVLRTSFVQAHDRPVQKVHAPDQWPIKLHCMADADGSASSSNMQVLIARFVEQPFDLARDRLLRVAVWRVSVDEHVLVLVQHHIISDGVSMQVMVDELVQLYAGHSVGREVSLEPLPIQYADYAIWQRSWMEAGEKQRQLDYWVEKLGTQQSALALPYDHHRPAESGLRGQSFSLDIPLALGQALMTLARTHGVTPFMLLLASFQVLLYRYSGQSHIRVGVPVANRNRVETERLLGFFVNTQVLQAEVDGLTAFTGFLQQVSRDVLQAQAHQDLPYEQLVEALQPARNVGHNPLFQVMFNHQGGMTAPVNHPLPGGLQVQVLPWLMSTTQFDLSLDTSEQADGITASLTYAQDLFEASTIERMGEHWVNLLQGIVADPGQCIADLPLLSLQERDRTLQTWNATAVDYPQAACIHSLIEAQVRRTPDAVALTFAARHLSYGELNAQSNRLAHRLIEAGVGPDVRVGIAMQRSPEMVVGLLAILKAGGAYVPLDPEYPQERLSYMIQDSGIGLLLSAPDVLERLPSLEGVEVLRLDGDDQWLAGYRESDPDVSMSAGNLAYVIYTSGSTGRPKGVGNEHRGLVNRLLWMQAAYGLDERDAVMQKTPFSFDVSVWEFFWPLLTGSRLVIAAPGAHREPQALIELIVAEGVTTLHFVPSMLQAFVQGSGLERCQSLKRIVCSGEALPVQAQLQVFARLPWAGLYNLYGPTEAAIDVTHWHCVDESRDAVPIGRPIDNMGCQILDAGLEPVVAGVQAELYLQGVGLARGYVGRASLTAERFVPNPYVSGERMYRTGDLASQRHDGVIEYAGRIDHQVKLRGLRIELGEIEARLLECPGVREAVVSLISGARGEELVAYLVAAYPAEALSTSSVREHLKTGLPDYMIPGNLMILERLPLTSNGKLDRKALPEPDTQGAQRTYVAPRSQLEHTVAGIWSEVLGLEQVGLTSDFFELGGHSLLVTQVIVRLRERLQVEVPVKLMFSASDLEGFCAQVQGCLAAQTPVDDVLAKSLEAMKRLSADELEKLIS